jgi:hypothetical protein
VIAMAIVGDGLLLTTVVMKCIIRVIVAVIDIVVGL